MITYLEEKSVFLCQGTHKPEGCEYYSDKHCLPPRNLLYVLEKVHMFWRKYTVVHTLTLELEGKASRSL